MHSKKVLTFSAIMLVTLLLFGACFAACGSTVETTITYYVDGEVYRTVTVTGTDMADPEITPSKTGFNFVGWYTDEALTEPFDFGAYAADADRQDISVYAKFEKGSSPVDPDDPGSSDNPGATETTITYIVDGAAWDSAIVDADTEQDPSKTPNKDGYAFVGWYTNESLTTPFNFADYIVNRQRKDISVYAKWISAQDCFTYEENGSSYTITGLTKDGAYISILSIPASYNGKPVTAIGSSAFLGCNSLTSIIIPDSVTSIGERVFYGCSSLTSITLPFVGQYADGSGETHFGYIFGATDCSYNDNYVPTSLKEVVITGGESIDSYAFDGCSSLTSITIGGSVTSIEDSAFYGCSRLTDVHYQGDIGGWASIDFGYYTANPMYYADNLYINGELLEGEVIIPDEVQEIKDYAFCGVDSITSVVIPDSVASIGWGAFYGCSSLTSITIGDSVTSIGGFAFYGCSSLTSITIGNSVTSIGEFAFYGCGSLTSITIPDSVTSIGESAFENCSSLTSVVIPESVTTIGYRAFSGCGNLTSVTIGDGVTSIGIWAFSGCSSLTSIDIPDSVTSIGSGVFAACSALESLSVEQGNPVYHSDDNCIIETATNTLVVGCKNSVIPNDGSVTSLGGYAFEDCSSLTSIVIPESVTTIDYRTFYGCSSLTSINIPDSVTSIGDYAFYGCSSLTSITIPNSVTSIGAYAFSGCGSLTSVTIGDGVTSIGNSAFSGCSSLTSVTIGDGVTSIGSSAFYGCNSLTSITIPNRVTSIGSYAFSGCSRLTSINIPDSVTSIGSSAFSGCSSLTSITIPNSVTSIGYEAFYGCNSLTIYCEAASKPSGWDSGWNYSDCPVVWNCNNNEVADDGYIYYVADNGVRYALDPNTSIATIVRQLQSISGDIVIPESVTYNDVAYSVTSIDGYAFRDCNSLTSVSIPDSVTSIGSSAFSGCSSLESLSVAQGNPVYHSDGNCIIETATNTLVVGCKNSVIPDDGSVTSIGEYAFFSCSSLTSISIPDSVTSIGAYAFYGCSSLTSITIPDSVTSIGEAAFLGCSSLTIYCEAASQPSGWDSDWNSSNCPVVGDHNNNEVASDGYIYHIADDGIRYALDPNTSVAIVAGQPRSISGDIVIPESVTYNDVSYSVTGIGNSAFSGCSSLTSVVIPESVTTIGYRAFYGCSSLTSITIPNSVTSIGSYAFSGCSSLTSITIPNSVTSIGYYAFEVCDSLTIYCEAASKPNGWDQNWNPNNCPVVWEYTGQ